MQRNCNIRPREDDEDSPTHGRLFKKRLLTLKTFNKSEFTTPGRTMTAHISTHNWNEGVGRSIGQKTFVTTCHFQPKRVPVRYTETMILNINSAKRRYFESVAYETKMVPSHWSQTMFVDLVQGKDRVISEVHIPCDIYVPLIPQEVITQNISEKDEQCPEKMDCSKANISNSTQTNSCGKPVKGEILDKYHKNTCEEFLNEMRKMY